jgi:hypothetical protein
MVEPGSVPFVISMRLPRQADDEGGGLPRQRLDRQQQLAGLEVIEGICGGCEHCGFLVPPHAPVTVV